MPRAGKNSYFIVRDESGQNVCKVTDKVADVPITTQHKVPTSQWLRKSRRPRRSHRCSTVSEIVDAHIPQVEEEQIADAATHSSKLEA